MRIWFANQRMQADGAGNGPLWGRFLKWFAAVLGALLAAAWTLLLLVDPHGHVPFSLPFKRDLVELNQRYFYPLVIRQGGYDSLIVGTSTIRLLDPHKIAPVMEGRFANLAMNAATAWEQWKLVDLYLREAGRPKNLVIGLDKVWCDQKADTPEGRLTLRGFPDWLYDDNRWNGLLYLLNGKTLEVAGRALAVKLGWAQPRYREDGFEVFTPPEDSYDLARARLHLWGAGEPRPAAPVTPAVVLSPQEAAALRFPAVDWLADILARAGPATRVVLLWTPPHVAELPAPGSRAAAVEEECKARMDARAHAAGAMVIDWRRRSPLTLDDSNFWDPVHYRLPIASRLVESIRAAMAGATGAGNGDWVRRLPAGAR